MVFEIYVAPRKHFKGQGHYSKVKGHTMTLHANTAQEISLPSKISYTLQFLRYIIGQHCSIIMVPSVRYEKNSLMLLHQSFFV